MVPQQGTLLVLLMLWLISVPYCPNILGTTSFFFFFIQADSFDHTVCFVSFGSSNILSIGTSYFSPALKAKSPQAHKAHWQTVMTAVCSPLCYWLTSYLPTLSATWQNYTLGSMKVMPNRPPESHFAALSVTEACAHCLAINKWKGSQIIRAQKAYWLCILWIFQEEYEFQGFHYFFSLSLCVNEITGSYSCLCVRGSSSSCELFIIHAATLRDCMLFCSPLCRV